ncbi:hypothetical protein R1flu_026786 [Riccia fluitans]|uniref:Uncharacterized protein n=1 Tax=Riccia fluitans TaxID=41844 RepID=A0ABD1XGX4_9MARC
MLLVGLLINVFLLCTQFSYLPEEYSHLPEDKLSSMQLGRSCSLRFDHQIPDELNPKRYQDNLIRCTSCLTRSLCGHGPKEWLQFSRGIAVHGGKCLNRTQQEWTPVFSLSSARPTLDDVERLSRGRASKAKIGSRAVPHRLNVDERKAFELAKKRGFVVHQPSTRRYPLINSHRNYCDALGIPCIRIEQGLAGQADEVVIDLTPLRLSEVDMQDFQKEIIKVVASLIFDSNRLSVADEANQTSVQEEIVYQREAELADSLTAESAEESTDDLQFKPLRFQASTRSEAKTIAQNCVEAWKSWSRSNLNVPA